MSNIRVCKETHRLLNELKREMSYNAGINYSLDNVIRNLIHERFIEENKEF